MTIELVPTIYNDHPSYAAVDEETGLINVPFTQFIIWLSLGKVVRKEKCFTRGAYPTKHTIREFAYRLKRWFDFISDWNQSARSSDFQIKWNTAQKKHMDYFKATLCTLTPNTRNGLQTVWDMFYEDFCSYMGYKHLMLGLSVESQANTIQVGYAGNNHLGSNKSSNQPARKSLFKESGTEKLTYRVGSLDDIALLLKSFYDPVYKYFSYFMFTTGLRIGGAIQVRYPNTDKNNKYITSPELLRIDYEITDMFPFNYVYKGHEKIGDFYHCDVPLYAWEDIWENYRPLQTERLTLWRALEEKRTGKNCKNQFPQSFWLDKTGKEITFSGIWKAFRETIGIIRKNGRPNFPDFVPQMLRHSYATWLVICYAEAQNLPLDPNDISIIESIHAYIQEQLGHSQRSTTLIYIRTAARVIKKRWLPNVMPRLLPDGRIVKGVTPEEAKSTHLVDFNGYMQSLTKELMKS